MHFFRVLSLLIMGFASVSFVSANTEAVSEMRFLEDDKITPSLVEHRCEEMFEGEQLVQIYNYIYYEFQTEEQFYWARAYLDEIEEVSILGPFSDASRSTKIDEPIDPRIIAFFGRRYQRLKTLTDEGYKSIP